jgi:hypothetical protein
MTTPRVVKACLSTAAIVLFVGLGACTSNAPYPQAAGANVPVPGAQPPVDNYTTAQAYTSDNQPGYTRSGLNSDPANPSGVPGPATITSSNRYTP